ncbi:hypothetical protein DVA86_03295 [Streptomyces armeniacus]|uniref:Uncharacterized protein n=1 Tax=Streptomyces armeniacus TaxID=83291 RepID=A0A345XJJ9_9ACTN|nr:hypothetical protein [Streptomyces armeniacus]AXK31815.1 hypothetical protein DVA86_03295 [Streptomyces armeniacus]
MSVYIALFPTAVPLPPAEDADRTLSFEDRAGGEEPVEFQYSVHPSGALVVWRCFADASPVADTAYGPSAWRSVRGTVHRSL